MHNIKTVVMVALGAALIWVSAVVAIPVGPVPITLQTMIVVVVGMLLGPWRAVLAVLLYYLLGIMGVPVFAGFKSGIAVLTASPTAGFALGFLPAALISGLLCSLAGRTKGALRYTLVGITALVGMITPYLLGIPLFMNYTGKSLADSLPLVLIPFIPGDSIKTVAAILIGVALLKFRDPSQEEV